MKRGDAVAMVAQPIAKGIDYFLGTDIQHCLGCHQMETNLNNGMSWSEALYDRFFKEQKQRRK